ncbi:calcineurin-like phosphoesterase C-terminal domain-containing protein [Arthrobacter sp. ZGTC412]|uniref:calcineurin-like phosphoesterase C-terminal domain-containing protein n=1 Tax=Arthrobacter sp. ZGTC412 TaxID=2058900 RepID=UPI000CE2E59C|nr:calcineurin-like phosphoesterase C-terminal domain-containing protein [Arthrobacter sp. ZGTC412]
MFSPAATAAPAPVMQPGAPLATAPLQITEITPDTSNVGTADGFEFIEVYNASSEPLDFSDYTLRYLYPRADLTNSNVVDWPSVPREVSIAPGGTLVFWIKNGQNDSLTDADFNAKFGSSLVMGENLVEIFTGGMANGSPRGLEIATNTGFGLNRAYYNLDGADNTSANRGIQFSVNPEDPSRQTLTGLAAASPGSVTPNQVPAGLMVLPVDSVEPSVTDATGQRINPAADYSFEATATDNQQVRTVTLNLRSDLEPEFQKHYLKAGQDDRYEHVLDVFDPADKLWYEYYFTVTDGTNTVNTEVRRVNVEGADSAPAESSWAGSAYRGGVEVLNAAEANQQILDGTVFHDRNRNSTQDSGEPGLPGVTVSNGRDVVTTDGQGRYELPVFDNMTAFVTQPRGYQVPVDQDNVAQFFYNHLPAGSPALKYGGIAPTGALPDKVNFPLAKSGLTQSPEQHCVLGADVQTYDQEEVRFARNGVFADLAGRTDYAGCGALFLGDIVGNDLSLYSQTRNLTSMLNGPARFLPGNHDLDFDALDGEHEFDTFRAQFGPEYYSYDAGKAHVVALSNIVYPGPSGNKYDSGISDRQLEWLRADIASVPEDRVIVLGAHSPLLEFFYSDTHSTQPLKEIYKILEGREVISLAGHTHMSENLRKGDLMAGWADTLGQDGLPFTHLTVPAVSGQWYEGRTLEEGFPTSVQRDGTPPGVLTLDIKNTEIRERFTATGDDGSDQMALGINSPTYRTWYDAYKDRRGSAPAPQNPNAVTQSELGETWLTTNFWMGATGSTVKIAIDGGQTVEATRTQSMTADDIPLIGAEYTDPVASLEQLVHGGGLHDRTSHLWRLKLPAGLAIGEHAATVTATDSHGQEFTETLTFEVTE